MNFAGVPDIACMATDYVTILAVLAFGIGVGVCVTAIINAAVSKREVL